MEEVKKQGTESLFVPYEIALALKELGFDEPCLGWWSTTTPNIELMIEHVFPGEFRTSILFAPTFSQAFRWFREKHQLEGEVHCIRFNSKRLKGYQYAITFKNYQSFEQLGDYYAYEEAELECLKKLIKIVKNLK